MDSPLTATARGAPARTPPAADIPHSESRRATGRRSGTAGRPRRPGIALGTPSATWESRAGPRRHATHGGVRSQPDRQLMRNVSDNTGEIGALTSAPISLQDL